MPRFLNKVGKHRTFDALRYRRDFRFLLASNFIHSLSSWAMMLAKTWLVYEITGSAFLVAMYAAARTAPHLIAPFLGVLADRVNRRKLVIVMRILDKVCAAALAILIALGLLEYWHLVVIGFVQGVIMASVWSAGGALVIDIVGKEHLTNAIAFDTIAMDVCRIVGPALGGILIATVGPANCFWIAAAGGLISVIVLFFIRAPTQTMASGRESVWRNLTEGAKYVIRNRDVLAILVITVAANVFVYSGYQSFVPVFAKDNMGQGPLGLGFLQTASGVGALIAAITVASLGNLSWKGKMFLGGILLYGVSFGAVALSRSFPLGLALMAVAGLSSTGYAIMQRNLLLTLAPDDMRGRILGFLSLAIGGMLFGTMALGVAANVIGASLATGISCALVVVAVIVIAVIFPNLRRLG